MEQSTQKINFVCPECGGETLVRIQTVTEREEVCEIKAYGEEDPVEELPGCGVTDSTVEDVTDYACANCEYSLGVYHNDEVIAWLRERGMVEDGEPK